MTDAQAFGTAPSIAGAAASSTRCCDHPGCTAEGTHRAPRARDLSAYFWFCLEHVRAYNAGWDYFRGMSMDEIEAHRRADVTWWRPTWPLGAYAARRADWRHRLRDDLGLLGGDDEAARRRAAADHAPSRAESAALATLDLTPGATQTEIRARYLSLAKRLHPDANGGDKSAEERLKSINRAYATLKSHGL